MRGRTGRRFTVWLSGWRAATRIARRDAWRNKGRSALIALMVALPVAAAAFISVLYQSDEADPQDQIALHLGSSPQASISWTPGTGAVVQDPTGNGSSVGVGPDQKLSVTDFEQRLAEVLPGADRAVPQVLSWQQLVGFKDRVIRADVIEVDYPSIGAGGPVEQLSGRAPATDGEVVVTRALARAEDVDVGDQLSFRPTGQVAARSFSVVGTVGGLPLTGQQQVIGRPGALLGVSATRTPTDAEQADRTERTWFVAGPAPVTWAEVQQLNLLGASVLSRAVVENPPPVPAELENLGSSVDSSFVATGAVVVGLVLLQIALMAGPAIAVGTRRNERGLAVVAAAGGEGRHLRAVVLAGSALIGLVASVAAAAVGTGLAAVVIPVLRSHWEVQFARVDVHLLDLAVLVAVGTVTAFAAALLPARRVGRLDVVAALTGRRPTSAPRLRIPLTGMVLVAAGFVLAWVSAGQAQQFPTVLGLGLAEIGLVVASPAVVGLAARASSRTSFASRFAFRDAARQRGRTAPAVAAVLAAIAGGMTAIVFVHASVEVDRATYTSTVPLGAVDVSLDPYQPGYSSADAGPAEAALRRTMPVAATTVLQEPKGDAHVTVWQKCPTPAPDPSGYSCQGTTPFFADQDAAAVFAGGQADQAGQAGQSTQATQVRAALAAGKVVVFERKWLDPAGTVAVTSDDPGQDDGAESPSRRVPAVLVETGQPLSGPLAPVGLARTLGVDLQASHVVASTTRPPTTVEQGQARKALQSAGLGASIDVERGYEDSDGGLIVLILLLSAAVVALIGTFTAVGLAAAEARADLGTLAAVGAAPGLRRRLGAAQAGAIVVPGAILGLISGTGAGWVLIRLNSFANADWQDQNAWHLTVPWQQAAALGLGIPLLAVVVGFLTVRSRLVLVRRLGE